MRSIHRQRKSVSEPLALTFVNAFVVVADKLFVYDMSWGTGKVSSRERDHAIIQFNVMIRANAQDITHRIRPCVRRFQWFYVVSFCIPQTVWKDNAVGAYLTFRAVQFLHLLRQRGVPDDTVHCNFLPSRRPRSKRSIAVGRRMVRFRRAWENNYHRHYYADNRRKYCAADFAAGNGKVEDQRQA